MTSTLPFFHHRKFISNLQPSFPDMLAGKINSIRNCIMKQIICAFGLSFAALTVSAKPYDQNQPRNGYGTTTYSGAQTGSTTTWTNGNYATTTGKINGQTVNTTTYYYGNGASSTTGRIGSANVNTSTYSYGNNMSSTTGRIGSANVNTSTYSYGNNMSSTTGRIGNSTVSGSTYSYGSGAASSSVRISTPSIVQPYVGLQAPKKKSIYDR